MHQVFLRNHDKASSVLSGLPLELIIHIYEKSLLNHLTIQNFLKLYKEDDLVGFLFKKILEERDVKINDSLEVKGLKGLILDLDDLNDLQEFMKFRDVKIRLRVEFLECDHQFKSFLKNTHNFKEVALLNALQLLDLHLTASFCYKVTHLSILEEMFDHKAMISLLSSGICPNLKTCKFIMHSNGNFPLLRLLIEQYDLEYLHVMIALNSNSRFTSEEIDYLLEISSSHPTFRLEVENSLEEYDKYSTAYKAYQKLKYSASTIYSPAGWKDFSLGEIKQCNKLNKLWLLYSIFDYMELQSFPVTKLKTLTLLVDDANTVFNFKSMACLEMLKLKGCHFSKYQIDCFPSSLKDLVLDDCRFDDCGFMLPLHIETFKLIFKLQPNSIPVPLNLPYLDSLVYVSLGIVELNLAAEFLKNVNPNLLKLDVSVWARRGTSYIDQQSFDLTHLENLQDLKICISTDEYRFYFYTALLPSSLERLELRLGLKEEIFDCFTHHTNMIINFWEMPYDEQEDHKSELIAFESALYLNLDKLNYNRVSTIEIPYFNEPYTIKVGEVPESLIDFKIKTSIDTRIEMHELTENLRACGLGRYKDNLYLTRR